MIKKRRSYGKNKIKILKVYIVIVLIVCVAAGAYILTDRALEPILGDIAKIRVKEAVSEAINEAVTEVLIKTENNNFLELEKDENGYISTISANTVYMNEFSSQITSVIHKNLKELKGEKVTIPIGSIIGSNILSQTGPSINLKITPIGNASIDFSTEFESAGINQTKYKVYMEVTGKAKPIIPFVSDVYEITTTVPVAETVIVGNVPQTYLSLPSEVN